jgi:hypothetical protein
VKKKKKKKKKKRKTKRRAIMLQIGTSQTNPCIPEQGRAAKASDVK